MRTSSTARKSVVFDEAEKHACHAQKGVLAWVMGRGAVGFSPHNFRRDEKRRAIRRRTLTPNVDVKRRSAPLPRVRQELLRDDLFQASHGQVVVRAGLSRPASCSAAWRPFAKGRRASTPLGKPAPAMGLSSKRSSKLSALQVDSGLPATGLTLRADNTISEDAGRMILSRLRTSRFLARAHALDLLGKVQPVEAHHWQSPQRRAWRSSWACRCVHCRKSGHRRGHSIFRCFRYGYFTVRFSQGSRRASTGAAIMPPSRSNQSRTTIASMDARLRSCLAAAASKPHQQIRWECQRDRFLATT